MASDHITVGERILLHLRPYVGKANNISAPFEVTQDGIAAGIGVTRAHASIEVNLLVASGEVDEAIRHIPGGKGARKVYTLTAKGLTRSKSLGEYLTAFKIDVTALNRSTRGSRDQAISRLHQDISNTKAKIDNMELRLKALESGA